MRSYTLFAKLLMAWFIGVFYQTTQAQTVLYGMTQNGGADSVGAIIAYNVTTGNESVVWSFASDTDGQAPTGSLVYCPLNGLLYGLTTSGGKYLSGAIISFNPVNNDERVNWSFGHSGNAPAIPYGDLVYDTTNQLFYGMTFSGGNNAIGSVFQFNPVTDSAKELWHFGYGGGASLPYGNLVLNPNDGLYYGMTTEGGNYNDGAIITLNTTTDTVHRVYNFNDGQSGETPDGSLIWNEERNLFYGVTSAGGTDSMGTIFSFDPTDSTETTLFNFGFGNDIQQPFGNLIYDRNSGLFIGLGLMGGTNSTGGIYTFDPVTDSETVVYNFGSAPNDGSFPNGSLIYDPDNQLYYGFTQDDGANQQGTIFSFNLANNALTTLWGLGAGFDGAAPQGSLLLIKNGMPEAINQIKNNYKLNLYPNPTTGNFVLQSQNATGSGYSIYNTNGDIISTSTVQADIQNIHVSNIASGLYALMLNTKDGTATVRFAVVK